ncbi:glycosyl transferase [Vibrio breoganii]|uniref:glycosyl transferase n=1 Tax=Vibrio breoganii TaxID=553239 RepID=UPI000C81EF5F|nr:glycosyl transferase [Vibrio breoganii]
MTDSYGGLERAIARVLAHFPFVKKIAKSSYAKLMYMKHRKGYQFKSSKEVELVASSSDKDTFFGYFDKSPMSSSGFTLVHRSLRSTSELPSEHDCVQLCVYDDLGNSIFELETQAYNWQQGSRAHWLNEDLFIFNDFDEEIGKYVSRVCSIQQKKQIKQFDFPVQDSFRDKYFLSINYRRLMTLRPDYGYRNLPNLSMDEQRKTTNDGIWKVNLESGDHRMLFSIDDVMNIDWDKNFENTVHKLNHVMISPSGDRFIFLHRYYVGKRRVDRLLIANADGEDIRVLANFGMVSHCFWADNKTVLGYLKGHNGQNAYWLINVDSGEFRHFAEGKLDQYGDGHPHVVGDWFVTDTYPDKARMQTLLYCNWKTGEIRSLGEFFHGFSFNEETRCDLHPRMSIDGKYIFFDSVFDGSRQLYRMKAPLHD